MKCTAMMTIFIDNICTSCTHIKVRLNIGTLVFWSLFIANNHTIYTHFRVARPDQTFGLDLKTQDHTCTRIQD